MFYLKEKILGVISHVLFSFFASISSHLIPKNIQCNAFAILSMNKCKCKFSEQKHEITIIPKQ